MAARALSDEESLRDILNIADLSLDSMSVTESIRSNRSGRTLQQMQEKICMAAVTEITELADQNPEYVTLDDLTADSMDGLSLDNHDPSVVTEADIDQQVNASNVVPANVTVGKWPVRAEDTPRALADMPCMSPARSTSTTNATYST